ncbi:MAG: flagellar biosynthesis protein FlhA [Alphaproteobacteria bacterium]
MSAPGFRDAMKVMQRGDVVFAIGLVCILSVLIVPLPTVLLDVMLALSISISVIVLMTTVFINRALDFSSFPTILLVTTLLRLGLNVATTRIILEKGHEGTDAAGHVIQAFGGFLMGGNFVIGLIVFAILVIVNFMVITKGSGRIAEVGARFTLDAMPGKQMAIDADLSSGLIDENEAKRRRKELEEESSFFGAMDGAAKFVRGDAVAGLIITAINLIGGILIGVLQRNMALAEAAHTYTTLTVGDGLVSQIPSLLVSVAAGLLVSKTGQGTTVDQAMFGQIAANPMALGITSGLMTVMALMPGLPALPFLVIAGATGGLAWYLPKIEQDKSKQKALIEQERITAEANVPQAEEPIGRTLAMDFIRLELGYGLLVLASGDMNNKLTDQIKGLRRQLAAEMGFVLPAVRIQDNLQLPANAYSLRIKEIEAATGEVRPTMLLCMDPRGGKIALPGEATTEPAFGLPAMWVNNNYREEAMFKGYTVVDPATVITTHLTETIKDHMPELLSYSETQKLLDEMDKVHQKLVADTIPSVITVGGLQRVLQNLLAERVSIRDMPTILEAVAEAASHTRNVTQMTEYVRGRLARQLCDSQVNSGGFLPLLTLSPEWEQAFAESLVGGGDEKHLAMAPSRLQQFIVAVRGAYEKFAKEGEAPVLLTSAYIRPYVRSIVERFRPQTTVMSQSEIYPRAKVRTLGQL